MKKLLALLPLVAILAACAPPPYLYYGNTSHSYYRAVKKQDEASVAQYKASLEKVFDRSADLGLPVPPGLYCDYAVLLLQEDRTEEARTYFAKEMQQWTESQTMVDFLMQRYGLKQ